MRAWWSGGVLLSALALLPGATVPLGCAAAQGAQDCTAAGCSSGVFVSIPLDLVPDVRGEIRSRACVEGRCGRWETADRDADVGWGDLEAELELERTYRVTIEVVDYRERLLLRGERAVEAELFAPNGIECGPVCHVASFELEADDVVRRRG